MVEVVQPCGALLSFDEQVRNLRNSIQAQMGLEASHLSDETLLLMFERVIESGIQHRMHNLLVSLERLDEGEFHWQTKPPHFGLVSTSSRLCENYGELALYLTARCRDVRAISSVMTGFWPLIFDFLFNDLLNQLNSVLQAMSYDQLRCVRYRIMPKAWCVQLALRSIL